MFKKSKVEFENRVKNGKGFSSFDTETKERIIEADITWHVGMKAEMLILSIMYIIVTFFAIILVLITKELGYLFFVGALLPMIYILLRFFLRNPRNYYRQDLEKQILKEMEIK